MIQKLSFKNFKAVPYLEGSPLFLAHPHGFGFSSEKPNVIVGPNGSGKSALMKTLALQTLSFYTGCSSFDNQYVSGRDAETYWVKDKGWGRSYSWLSGMEVVTDYAPALFYLPGMIVGDESSVTAAMMVGYFDEARAYDTMTRNKSSGQRAASLMEKIMAVLSGETMPNLQCVNWRFGKEPKDLSGSKFVDDYTIKAEILKQKYGNAGPGAIPVVLLDEPEQSLDAKTEAAFWRQVAHSDCSRVQVIAATHSLYPFLHADQFNIIESVPGYVKEVLEIIKGKDS